MNPSQTKITIKAARTNEDIAAVAQLFEAYAEFLGVDLTFQSFAEELATLPKKYEPPYGEILLASTPNGIIPLGVIALRPLSEHVDSKNAHADSRPPTQFRCELKRLYVNPEARGLGVGEALVKAVVQKACEIGYEEAILDSLPSSTTAIRLYAKLGFVEIPPYYKNPLDGVVYMGLTLRDFQSTATNAS